MIENLAELYQNLDLIIQSLRSYMKKSYTEYSFLKGFELKTDFKRRTMIIQYPLRKRRGYTVLSLSVRNKKFCR